MTNAHQAACISEALREAAHWCFTSAQAAAAGWPMTQARLRAIEAAEEAATRAEAQEPLMIPFTVTLDDEMPPLVPRTE